MVVLTIDQQDFDFLIGEAKPRHQKGNKQAAQYRLQHD
jgi:hypothetical protein